MCVAAWLGVVLAAALATANYLLDCNKFINVYVLVGWLVGWSLVGTWLVALARSVAKIYCCSASLQRHRWWWLQQRDF